MIENLSSSVRQCFNKLIFYTLLYYWMLYKNTSENNFCNQYNKGFYSENFCRQRSVIIDCRNRLRRLRNT